MDTLQVSKIVENVSGLGLEVGLAAGGVFVLAIVLAKFGLGGKKGTFCSLCILFLPVLVAAIGIILSARLPAYLDSTLNGVFPDQRAHFYDINDQARALHKRLWLSDLHTDTLLWPARGDINERQRLGHVDVERLLEGNVALQGFTIVTSSPMFLNFETNPRPNLFTDTISYKSLIEGWGLDAVKSLRDRVLFQTSQFKNATQNSRGRLRLIKNKADLEQYIGDRKTNNITAGFLGIEGLHSLEGRLETVDTFYNEGVRMMSPTHFFDTELGGSAHGVQKGGLTAFGKDVIRKLEEKSIFVDVAHASEAVIDDVIGLAKRPIISSHTGVRGVCDNQRNLQDRHIIGIARSRGILGIGFFRPALCSDNLIESLVETMKYVKKLVGVQHIALGSDFDGAVYVPFDSSELIQITAALLQNGFSEQEIELIMGGNVLRLMRRYLPDE